MKTILSLMEKATRTQDHQKYLKQHMKFHDIFIEACGNESLIDMLERLRKQAFWFRCSYHHFQTAIENTLEVHREILNYFELKDAKGSEHLVKKHILDALGEVEIGEIDFPGSRIGQLDELKIVAVSWAQGSRIVHDFGQSKIGLWKRNLHARDELKRR